MNAYPPWFRSVLFGCLLALLASGILLASTTLVTRAELDLAWRVPSAVRVPITALHALGGFVLVALAGALWSIHMRAGWRARHRRPSGGLLAGCIVALVVTAVVAAYAGDDLLGAGAAIAHLALGAAGAVPFALHALRKRRSVARTPRHAARG